MINDQKICFQVSAAHGYKTTLIDVNDQVLQKSNSSIKKNLERAAKVKFTDVEKQADFVKTSLINLTLSTKLESASNTDLVIEAVIENIQVKHEIFSTLDKIAPSDAIFASNTSSLGIGEIAAITKNPGRFAGLHFFNPVPMINLLEVVRTEKTSENTINSLLEWGTSVGKTCIVCKDIPGFIVNRLLTPILTEAARMLSRGEANVKDIDTALKLGCGHPMGPFELSDFVGLDTLQQIIKNLHKSFPNNPLFEPIDGLDKLVAEGKFGVKTGEGYYAHKQRK